MSITNSLFLIKRFAPWVPVAAGVGLVIVAVAVWGGEWKQVLAPSPLRDLEGIVDMTRSADRWTTGVVTLTVEGSHRVTSGGLVLAPGARLRLHTPTSADQVDIALYGTPPRREWDLSIGDGEDHELSRATQPANGSRRRHRLDPLQPGLWVSIEHSSMEMYQESRSDGADGACLWWLRYAFAHRRANPLPPVPLLLAAILVSVLLLRLSFQEGGGAPGRRRETWFQGLRALAVVYGILFSISLKSWTLSHGQLWVVFGLHFLALLVGIALVRGESVGRPDGKGLNLRSARARWLLAVVVLLGFQIRWEGYADHCRQLLLPDAAGFLEIVHGGAWYETAASQGPWVREPLWIWVNRVAGWIIGLNENTLRLMSLLAGLLAIPQTARLCARWFGAGVGLLAAAGLALSPRWVEWTAHGLRTELYTFLVLTFVLAWDRAGERFRGSAREALGLGIVAAAAHLTYISSLAWTLPLLAWRVFRGRWPGRWIALSLAVALLPLLPHLVFNYRFHNSHDPFFSSNVHARFYRNYERQGLPGSPGRDRFLEDPYAGPHVTTLGYLFGEHSLRQLAAGALRGAWTIYLHRGAGIEQFGASKVLTLVYGFGVVVALFSSAGRRSVVLWVWIGLPFLFLASLPGFPTRLLAPLTPWMWFYLALGIVKVLGWTRALTGRGFADTSRKG